MAGWMLLPMIWLVISKASAANRRDRGIIPVVGFFQPDHPEQELAFRIAVERINVDRGFLPNTTLVPRVERVTVFDSFNTSKRVCSLTIGGIGAIFGPDSVSTSGIVESICDTMEIPHIQTHWETSIRPANCMVNLYPDPKLISKALIDVIRDMDWKSFTILYEEHDGLVRLQDVLKEHNGLLSQGGLARGTPFTLRQLDASGDYRPLLKEIQNSSETHIVLDCATDKVIPLLQQAKEVKLMGDYNSYIITSLDAHTLDYGEFRYSKTNITALRLVDPTRRHVQTVVHDWVFEEERHGRNLELTPETVKLESALMYDAVNIYAKALHGLSSTQPVHVKSLSCDNVDKWPSGYSLVNYMKILEMEGMTGKIQFDAQGHRSFFLLEIIELAQHGFKKIGSWDPIYGINYTRTTSEMYSDIVQSIKDKTFIVSSRVGEPYLRKKEGEGLVGNDRYEGYSMDLMDAIAKELDFKYEFVLVGDNKYGSLNKVTKQWDGLIKELMERGHLFQRADLAICDLTITYDRRSAVDFTMPFMTLGISILYSKPVKKAPDLFSFLLPLSLEVWICMMTAYLGISLLLYFLARCSPYEWENPHPCNPDPEELEQTFNLPNCLWFSTGSLMAQGCDLLPKITPNEWNNPHPCNPEPTELKNDLSLLNLIWHNCGSLMQQGSDIAPQFRLRELVREWSLNRLLGVFRALSTRMVAGMWWFFTLIMIASYTANLAAALTSVRMNNPIESVEDLAKQNSIKYGVLKGGSTANFFMESNVSMYQRMWSVMESQGSAVIVEDNANGVERVLKSELKYAYFMESTSIEYQIEKNCELTQVGGLLDSKGYGIAMPVDSPYRTAISGAVLKMQETNKLLEIKDRWWKEKKNGSVSCEVTESATDEEESSKLGLDNVGGVFLVLILGCGAAFIVAILEFLWNVRKVAVTEKISPSEAFMLELKFALRCHGSTKPVRPIPETKENSQPGSLIQLNVFDKFNVDEKNN